MPTHVGRGPGAGGIVLGGDQAVARVHRRRHRRAEVDVAEAHDEVARVEHDPLHVVDGGKAVDPADELDVVRAPGRVVTHDRHVLLDGLVDRRVLPGQRQVHHPRGDLEVVQASQPVLGVGQGLEQAVLRQDAAVVVHLERADARGDVDDARKRQPLQLQHQGVDAKPELQVQDDGTVFHQQMPIPLPAVDGAGARAGALDRPEDRAPPTPVIPAKAGTQVRGSIGAGFRSWPARLGPGFRRDDRRLEGGDEPVLLGLRRHGLGVAHRLEPHRVARRELADLPEVGLDGHERAYEAAEGRPVRPQDDRHVAGEVDRAHGIGVVVDVGGVQPRLAPVPPRPLRLWPDQPHARAVGVVVHAPVGAQHHGDVLGREEVRRPVRSVEHANGPRLRQRGPERRVERRLRAAAVEMRQAQHIAGRQRPPGMPPEPRRG